MNLTALRHLLSTSSIKWALLTISIVAFVLAKPGWVLLLAPFVEIFALVTVVHALLDLRKRDRRIPGVIAFVMVLLVWLGYHYYWSVRPFP